MVMSVVIMMNALVLGISADWQPAHPAWKALNIVFNMLYTLEICIKMWCDGVFQFFWGASWAWNIFIKKK